MSETYSEAFIRSQIEYYRRHLLSGNASDRSLIHGCLMNYERLLRKLLSRDSNDYGCYKHARVR